MKDNQLLDLTKKFIEFKTQKGNFNEKREFLNSIEDKLKYKISVKANVLNLLLFIFNKNKKNYFLREGCLLLRLAVLLGLNFSAPLPLVLKPRCFLPALVRPLSALPFFAEIPAKFLSART